MDFSKNLEFYKRGLKLLNKNIDLYIVAAVTVLITSSLSLMGNGLFALISIPISLISFSYILSIPFFLRKREESKINYEFIFYTSLTNLKRLILPFIGLFLLVVAILIMGAVTVVIVFKPGAEDFRQFFSNFADGRFVFHPLMIIAGLIVTTFMSMFIFQSIYFSLEKTGVIRSFIKSFQFSLKHFKFIIPAILITYLLSQTFYIIRFFFSTLSIQLSSIMISLISEYTGLVITCAAYLYYRSHKGEIK